MDMLGIPKWHTFEMSESQTVAQVKETLVASLGVSPVCLKMAHDSGGWKCDGWQNHPQTELSRFTLWHHDIYFVADLDCWKCSNPVFACGKAHFLDSEPERDLKKVVCGMCHELEQLHDDIQDASFRMGQEDMILVKQAMRLVRNLARHAVGRLSVEESK